MTFPEIGSWPKRPSSIPFANPAIVLPPAISPTILEEPRTLTPLLRTKYRGSSFNKFAPLDSRPIRLLVIRFSFPSTEIPASVFREMTQFSTWFLSDNSPISIPPLEFEISLSPAESTPIRQLSMTFSSLRIRTIPNLSLPETMEFCIRFFEQSLVITIPFTFGLG